MDSPFLDWFQVLRLCAVNEVMPGRRSVFENWWITAVQMEKLFIWNSRSLELLQVIETFASFWGDIVNVCGPGEVCVKYIERGDAFNCIWWGLRPDIGPKSRTERPRKTKIGTEIAHVTRDSDTNFKVKIKGQGHQAALLSAALTRKAAAAVSVGTNSAWESNAMLCLVGGARGAWAPTGEGEGRGILCRHAHSLYLLFSMCHFAVISCR